MTFGNKAGQDKLDRALVSDHDLCDIFF